MMKSEENIKYKKIEREISSLRALTLLEQGSDSNNNTNIDDLVKQIAHVQEEMVKINKQLKLRDRIVKHYDTLIADVRCAYNNQCEVVTIAPLLVGTNTGVFGPSGGEHSYMVPPGITTDVEISYSESEGSVREYCIATVDKHAGKDDEVIVDAVYPRSTLRSDGIFSDHEDFVIVMGMVREDDEMQTFGGMVIRPDGTITIQQQNYKDNKETIVVQSDPQKWRNITIGFKAKEATLNKENKTEKRQLTVELSTFTITPLNNDEPEICKIERVKEIIDVPDEFMFTFPSAKHEYVVTAQGFTDGTITGIYCLANLNAVFEPYTREIGTTNEYINAVSTEICATAVKTALIEHIDEEIKEESEDFGDTDYEKTQQSISNALLSLAYTVPRTQVITFTDPEIYGMSQANSVTINTDYDWSTNRESGDPEPSYKGGTLAVSEDEIKAVIDEVKKRWPNAEATKVVGNSYMKAEINFDFTSETTFKSYGSIEFHGNPPYDKITYDLNGESTSGDYKCSYGDAKANIYLFQQSWPGTDASAEDVVIKIDMLQVDRAGNAEVIKTDQSYSCDPVITVDETGLISFNCEIPIGESLTNYDIPSQTQDVVPGHWKLGPYEGNVFIMTLPIAFQIQMHEPKITDFIPYTYVIIVKSIDGVFKYTKSPLNSGIIMINSNDARQDAALADIAYQLDDIVQRLNDMEQRLETIEAALKPSPLATIGGLVVGIAGFLPVGNALYVFLIAGSTMLAIDAAKRGSTEAMWTNLIYGFLGVAGAVMHNRANGKLNLDDIKFIDQIKEYVRKIGQPKESRLKDYNLDAGTINANNSMDQSDPEGIRKIGNQIYSRIPEDINEENYIAVYHSNLEGLKIDGNQMAEGGGISQRIYEMALKRRLAPTHSELKGLQTWHVIDGVEPEKFGVDYTIGVGGGIGDLNVGNDFTNKFFDATGTAIGTTQMFFKYEKDPDGNFTTNKEQLLLDKSKVTTDDLKNEAAYMYKVYYGSEYTEEGLERFLATEPWNEVDNEIYAGAFHAMQARLYRSQYRVDKKTVTNVDYTPAAMAALSKVTFEDYAQYGYKYDILRNNCQHYAYSIHAIMTGKKTQSKYVPEHFGNDWIRSFSAGQLTHRAGLPSSERIDIDEVYKAMTYYYAQNRDTKPRRNPARESFGESHAIEDDDDSLNKRVSSIVGHKVGLRDVGVVY